jgi:hypothetical protein
MSLLLKYAFELVIYVLHKHLREMNRSVGTSVANTFAPLILGGIGFDAYTTSLLNIPFGAVQLTVILIASCIAYKFRTKSVILTVLILPVVAGLAMLYGLPVACSCKQLF